MKSILFLLFLCSTNTYSSDIYKKLLGCGGSLVENDWDRFVSLARKITSIQELMILNDQKPGFFEKYPVFKERVRGYARELDMNNVYYSNLGEKAEYIKSFLNSYIEELKKTQLFKNGFREAKYNDSWHEWNGRHIGYSFPFEKIINFNAGKVRSSSGVLRKMIAMSKKTGIVPRDFRIGFFFDYPNSGVRGFFDESVPGTLVFKTYEFIDFLEGRSTFNWVAVHEFVHLLFREKEEQGKKSFFSEHFYPKNSNGNLPFHSSYKESISLEEIPAFISSIIESYRDLMSKKIRIDRVAYDSELEMLDKLSRLVSLVLKAQISDFKIGDFRGRLKGNYSIGFVGERGDEVVFSVGIKKEREMEALSIIEKRLKEMKRKSPHIKEAVKIIKGVQLDDYQGFYGGKSGQALSKSELKTLKKTVVRLEQLLIGMIKN